MVPNSGSAASLEAVSCRGTYVETKIYVRSVATEVVHAAYRRRRVGRQAYDRSDVVIGRMFARLAPVAIRAVQDVSMFSRTVSTTLVAAVLLPGCDPAILVPGTVITIQRSVRSRVIRRVGASVCGFTRKATQRSNGQPASRA